MSKCADPPPAAAPAYTDGLFHHLRIKGPADAMAAFRGAAAGAGVVPWHLDLDRIEEDAFLRLATPQGQARRSVWKARGYWRPTCAMPSPAGMRSRWPGSGTKKCCFDLRALVPVSAEILLLGPDHLDPLQ